MMQANGSMRSVLSKAFTQHNFVCIVRPNVQCVRSRQATYNPLQQPQSPCFAQTKRRLAITAVAAYEADQEYASEEQEIDIRSGTVIDGVVDGIRPYGAFVKIGDTGRSGLLHVSEISSEFVDSVDSVLEVGESIRCLVIRVDRQEGRISLSTKKLERSPGEMMSNRQAVFDGAEEMAAVVREEWAQRRAEKQARYDEDPESRPRREYRDDGEGRRGGGGRGGGRGGRGGGGRGGYGGRQERRERDWQ